MKRTYKWLALGTLLLGASAIGAGETTQPGQVETGPAQLSVGPVEIMTIDGALEPSLHPPLHPYKLLLEKVHFQEHYERVSGWVCYRHLPSPCCRRPENCCFPPGYLFFLDMCSCKRPGSPAGSRRRL